MSQVYFFVLRLFIYLFLLCVLRKTLALGIHFSSNAVQHQMLNRFSVSSSIFSPVLPRSSPPVRPPPLLHPSSSSSSTPQGGYAAYRYAQPTAAVAAAPTAAAAAAAAAYSDG